MLDDITVLVSRTEFRTQSHLAYVNYALLCVTFSLAGSYNIGVGAFALHSKQTTPVA